MEQLTVNKFFCDVCGGEIENKCKIVSETFVTNSSAGNELRFADDVRLAHLECVNDNETVVIAPKLNEFKALEKEVKRLTKVNDLLNDENAELAEENAGLKDTPPPITQADVDQVREEEATPLKFDEKAPAFEVQDSKGNKKLTVK